MIYHRRTQTAALGGEVMPDILQRLRAQEMWFPDLYSEAADEIEKLRAALRFYADGEWSDGYPGGVRIDDNALDFGDRARAALGGE